jgi:chloramphenicol-sensitive protein RarD
MTTEYARTRAGLFLGLGAYTLWGVLPLYFKAISGVRSSEIVGHRILWSLVLLGALVTLWRRWPTVRVALRTPKVVATLALTATLIGGNWLIYIWAVLNGHVLAGSLGYYLNPLVNVLLGVFLLKERLSRAQAFAVALAAAGVAALAWGAGDGLWISLALAGTFASYGFLRKVAPVDSLEGLSIETALLAPVALLYLLWLGQQGSGSFGISRKPTSCSCSPAPSPPFPCCCSRLPRSGCLILPSASFNISHRRCSSCSPSSHSAKLSPPRTRSASERSGPRS